MNKIRLFKVIPIFILQAVFFAGLSCAQEVTVGLLAEQTGDFARTGKDCMNGFALARKTFTKDDKAGNISLKFITGDSVGAAGPGLSEFKRMTEAGGAAAVILTRSNVALSVNPVSRVKKIPVLAVAAHPGITADNEYAFRFYPNANDEGAAIAEHAFKLGLKAAVVTTDDDFNLAVKKSFAINYAKREGKIVYEETLFPSEINFNTVVAKLRSKNADFVFSNLNLQQTGIFIKKLREAGVDLPLVSNFYLGLSDVQAIAGDAAKGAAYVQIKTDSSAIEFACFSALSALIQSLDKADFSLNSLAVYESLKNLKYINLDSQKIEIINREAKIPVIVKTVK